MAIVKNLNFKFYKNRCLINFFSITFKPYFIPFGFPEFEKFDVSTISGDGCVCVLPQSVGTCPFIYADTNKISIK